MNTPTIIAARNEAQEMGQTLEALSRQTSEIEPIVVVNGSTDGTADIARGMGAVLLESEEGKMRAIQKGLRYLGNRALEPLLILDADSRPFSRNWAQRMRAEVTGLSESQPAIIWGPYVFSHGINPILGSFITAASMRVSWADRHDDDPRTIRGGNTGLRLRTSDLLEEVLTLDNYWPREDVAIYDIAMEQGADKKVVFHPEAWVNTSGARITETIKNFIKDRRHLSRITDTTYETEGPPDSRPYNSPHSRHQNKNPKAGKHK